MSTVGPEASRCCPRRVGFWFTDKKRCQMKVEEHFGKQCQIHGMELVKIRLHECLESQGPFCAIVHKISDLMVLGEQGDTQAEEACKNLEAYACRHPDTIIIDPLPNVRLLSNRHRMFKATERVNTISETVFTPSFVELTTNNVEENLSKLREHGVKFPLVCKPLPSHGSSHAHQMCLIFGAHGLQDVQAPCVAQSFICHGAVLYKIFVVGRDYHVVDRPSLKNFQAGDQETIFFNSHDVSKHPRPSSWITKLDESDAALQQSSLPPAKSRLDEIVRLLQRKLGLDLFGIDVIVQTGTGNCAVIDVNTFPGYTEVSGLWESVCQLILRTLPPKPPAENTPNMDNSIQGGVSSILEDLPSASVIGDSSENDDRNHSITTFDHKDSKKPYKLNAVLEKNSKSCDVAGVIQDSEKSSDIHKNSREKVLEGITGKNSRRCTDLADQHKKIYTAVTDVLKDDMDNTSRMNILKKSRGNHEITDVHTESRYDGNNPDVSTQSVDNTNVVNILKKSRDSTDVLKDSREDSGIDTSDSCDEKKTKNDVGVVWKHDAKAAGSVILKKKK